MKTHVLVASLILFGVGFTHASTVDSVLWNATTNGAGDEPPGLSFNFSTSPPLFGTDQVQEAFGQNAGPIEPGTFLFSDTGTPDNGNQTLGDGGETVDSIGWNTTVPVVVNGYRVGLGAEGPPGYNRGTQLFAFFSAGELDDFFDDNAQSGTVDRYFSIPQVAGRFDINLTRQNVGPRISEIDAIVPDAPPPQAFVDPILFNATTNGPGDEAPGLAFGFASSPSIPGDTIEDAFGNNDGGIEPTTFIFSDAGVGDNRNNTFDPGAETIDFISWKLTRAYELYGYQISVTSDGASEYRGAELLRFYVEDVLVDIIDLNNYDGSLNRIFPGGPVWGDDFRVELTRTVGNGGPRIVEIDAIVPEPASLAMLALGALGSVLRQSGRRTR